MADTRNKAIRGVTPDGHVTTLARSLAVGSTDGLGSVAQFGSVDDLAVDVEGNVYVADVTNRTIRTDIPVSDPARLINFSVLTTLSGGEDVLTVGAIVGGAGTQTGPAPGTQGPKTFAGARGRPVARRFRRAAGARRSTA